MYSSIAQNLHSWLGVQTALPSNFEHHFWQFTNSVASKSGDLIWKLIWCVLQWLVFGIGGTHASSEAHHLIKERFWIKLGYKYGRG